ncbi:hypothetical protein CRUP_009937 [Coryphaenoides rupestris]|nr:hypothetical protein CRUP_009937 [Coryphaenoides rupestris]
MLNSLSDLHGYVDKCQLTCELGGSLDYCHSQWIHHRTAIENFAVTVKTTAKMLQRFGTDLAETELPNDVPCTKDLLTAHTEKHNTLKLALKQGTTLLGCIKEQSDRSESHKLNPDEIENHTTVERLLAQLDETENAFEQFWSKHHLKLEQCLQLRHFEQDYREASALRALKKAGGRAEIFEKRHAKSEEAPLAKTDTARFSLWPREPDRPPRGPPHQEPVKVSLDILMAALSFTDIGDCVAIVELLLKELKSLEEKAQATVDKAQLQASHGDQLIQSNHYAVDSIRPKCVELRRVCDDFSNEARRKTDVLSKSLQIHRGIDKVNQWCESGIYLLASQAVDKCQTQEGAESALADIERFLETVEENELTELRNIHNQYELVLSENVKVNHGAPGARLPPFRK